MPSPYSHVPPAVQASLSTNLSRKKSGFWTLYNSSWTFPLVCAHCCHVAPTAHSPQTYATPCLQWNWWFVTSFGFRQHFAGKVWCECQCACVSTLSFRTRLTRWTVRVNETFVGRNSCCALCAVVLKRQQPGCSMGRGYAKGLQIHYKRCPEICAGKPVYLFRNSAQRTLFCCCLPFTYACAGDQWHSSTHSILHFDRDSGVLPTAFTILCC